MDWITIEQVNKAARESHKAALAMTKKHWEQLCTATKQEIIDAYKNGLVSIQSAFCALCIRYYDWFSVRERCNECPLSSDTFHGTCCKEWKEAARFYNPEKGRLWKYRKFQKRAKIMYKKICSIEEKQNGKR